MSYIHTTQNRASKTYMKAYIACIVKTHILKAGYIKDTVHTDGWQMNLKQKAFENIVGNGKNAGNQHFLLFPQCFLPFPNQFSILHSHFFFVLCKCFQFGPH